MTNLAFDILKADHGEDLSKFALNLRQLRKQNKHNRRDLAKLLGVSHQVIYYWETDNHYPNLVTFLKLCDVYKITPNQLLGF